jgi:hypothetical protein
MMDGILIEFHLIDYIAHGENLQKIGSSKALADGKGFFY